LLSAYVKGSKNFLKIGILGAYPPAHLVARLAYSNRNIDRISHELTRTYTNHLLQKTLINARFSHELTRKGTKEKRAIVFLISRKDYEHNNTPVFFHDRFFLFGHRGHKGAQKFQSSW